MFGKTRETNEMDTLQDVGAVGEFFGDEAAAAEATSVDQLRNRVEAVESQINSQFTSLATYAQIAQEQVELARAEARAHTERAEQRITSLVERERADRIASITGEAPAGSAPDVMARLDALEHSVAQIKQGLAECLDRQKQLAEAITTMFEQQAAPAAPAATEMTGAAAKPTEAAPLPAPKVPSAPLAGPIADLSLDT